MFAGYSEKTVDQTIHQTLYKTYIENEIKYRKDKLQKESIATGQEVMEFYTQVMQGKIKDQFGLESTLADRIKAANELAKRTIDIDNRINGKEDNNVNITLNLVRRNTNETKE